jgi:DNA-binding response OmpR family regulator
MLSGCGYRLYFAKNGHTCLDIVQNIQPAPSLILLDVEMPGLDGFETCERLKADESTKHIPVIFMTAHDSLGDKVRGFTVGGEDYITKPVRTDELIARVDTRLRLRKVIEDTAETVGQIKTLLDRVQIEVSQITDDELRADIQICLTEMNEILSDCFSRLHG